MSGDHFDCPECDRSFDSKAGLNSHGGQIHDVKPFGVDCVCKNCGKEFQVSQSEYERGVGECCSKACMGELKKDWEECICDFCGDEFEIPKNGAYNGDYCSNDCTAKDSRDRVETKCEYCGDQFEVKQSTYERGEAQHCSVECRVMNNSVARECEYCGDSFRIRKSRVENGRGRFCSSKCHYAWKRSDDPNIRQTSAYEEWRGDVLERDGYECQDCGSGDDLHTHHIISVSENSDKALDRDNGITVCVDCHVKRHEEQNEGHLAPLIKTTPTYSPSD